MKIITYKSTQAASAFCLFCLILSNTNAQEDRSERVQESISSSDQRTDFSARKAAPSKIDSFAFQDLLKARKKCKEARQRFTKSEQRYRQAESKAMSSSADKDGVKKARAELDAALASLRAAEAAVKAAEAKANAD